MTHVNTTPPGYMRNTQGHLVPIEAIAAIDIARNDLVLEIARHAHALQDAMASFKIKTMGDIAAFVQLSAEQYGAKLGGDKGNVSLVSFDGRYKIVRSNAESITFDERLIAAKELVDNCIHRWAQGSSVEIRALVEHAFQTDATGRINTARVLSLTRLEIHDAEWKQAMQAIHDSIQVSGSKAYVRIYERVGGNEKYCCITLDIAAL